MAYNPVSACRLPEDDPFFTTRSSSLPDDSRASQPYDPYRYHPSAHGNLQLQPGWGLISPPVAASHFPQSFANQQDWGPVASPSAGGDLPQMSTNQQEPALVDSPPLGGDQPRLPTNQQEVGVVNPPNPGGRISASQQRSVKHLTCWYWANRGCKLPEHVCLYSHYDTGRIADPPVRVQRGRKCSLPSSFISVRVPFFPNATL